MILLSIDKEVKSKPFNFLPLTSIHNMFIQPFGKIKGEFQPSSLVTDSVETFNKITFNHSVGKTLILEEDFALSNAFEYEYRDVKLITWSVSNDRIVGLMVQSDDEPALTIAIMYADEKKDL